jgi:hypothetical protein
LWSGDCGHDINVYENSNISLVTGNNQEAASTVDTEDVHAAIIYHTSPNVPSAGKTCNPTTINNSGIWHTTGNSTLVAGADTITNNSGGYIGTAAGAAQTTIQLGSGTNTITNASGAVIVAGETSLTGTAATPAVTRILGTTTFTNNGTIALGGTGTPDSGTTASDAKIDSVLFAPGAAFGGVGLIDLDANLWSDTQSAAACTTFVLTAADCLVIASSSGNNALKVTDTLAHPLSAFNPAGIVIVVGASNNGANFHLDPGSSWFSPGGGRFGGAINILDKPGLFFYDLAYNSGDSTERLISVPKLPAFEFASLSAATDDVWYATNGVWFDRQADLRDIVHGRPVGGRPGVWLKAVGDWSTRKGNVLYTDFNTSYQFLVDYQQDTAALIGGLDLLNVTDQDRAWVVGIQGGMVDSNVNFNHSGDRYHLSGGDFGIYSTYVSGGLFIDGALHADFMNMTGLIPGLSGNPPPSPVSNPLTVRDNFRAVGFQLEVGYQMPVGGALGANSFWEPLGVIAHVNTHLGPLTIPGGLQQFNHASSFRASIGARFGTTVNYQYYKMKFSFTGRLLDEFGSNPTTVLVVPGGSNFINTNKLRGLFGNISGQVNLFTNTSGLSVFANGGVKFKSNYTDRSVTIGARYQW